MIQFLLFEGTVVEAQGLVYDGCYAVLSDVLSIRAGCTNSILSQYADAAQQSGEPIRLPRICIRQVQKFDRHH